MIDILWDFFELGVTVFEEFVIIHFICRFLGYDFTTLKGRITYVFGSLVALADVQGHLVMVADAAPSHVHHVHRTVVAVGGDHQYRHGKHIIFNT